MEHRGTHATGSAYINPKTGKRVITKAPISASQFVPKVGANLCNGASTAILHTRYATQGSPTNAGNNHPIPRLAFRTGDVIAVAEDEHQWGSDELRFPFRVVHVPGPRSEWAYLNEAQPETLRDRYPASMLAVKRLHPSMQKQVRGGEHSPRQWAVNAQDQIIKKQVI